MSSEKFDEILDKCLTMMQAGVSIDDCVARYPQHENELRAQLQTAQKLWDAPAPAAPAQDAQARGRARIIAAATELRENPPPRPVLGIFAPLFRPFQGMRAPLRIGQALPAVVALLVVGGLAASAAVVQPDVPVLREIFGTESSSSSIQVPQTEIHDGTCELRGPITSLNPLIINGTTVDPTSAKEQPGDLAQAMADGAFVHVEGDFVGGICVAREIEVTDYAAGDEGEQTDVEDGECELRGPITSLDPLIINGITIDASTAEEIEGDLAQAMASGAEVHVEGTLADAVCVAREIKVEDSDDDGGDGDDGDNDDDGDTDGDDGDNDGDDGDNDDNDGDDNDGDDDGDNDGDVGDKDDDDGDGDGSETNIEDGECEIRGAITSLNPLVINGVTIDASSAEELEGDLAQALASGTEVRVKGDLVDNICIAREVKVADEEEESHGPQANASECDLRGPITSLEPLIINGTTIDSSGAEEVRGDLAQAMADGTEVRVKGDFAGDVCVADEIKVDEESEED